jgi:hypothetical protein
MATKTKRKTRRATGGNGAITTSAIRAMSATKLVDLMSSEQLFQATTHVVGNTSLRGKWFGTHKPLARQIGQYCLAQKYITIPSAARGGIKRRTKRRSSATSKQAGASHAQTANR